MLKNYKLLNEILIEWNESSLEDPDNTFLKSEDIKESFNKCFIYKLNRKARIKIFDADCSEFKKYRDKVWINGEHVELGDEGWTYDEFEPGKYRVYIEDIDKVTDMTCMFYDCAQLVSAFIPTGVETTGEYTFGNCSFLQNVFIPDSVKIIATGAFYRCTGLSSVTIPNSVTDIGGYAFYNCTGLSSITIPNSVTAISTWAFCDCSALESVTIGNSVTYIGGYAFYRCINIKTVYVENINKFNQIEFKSGSADPAYFGAKIIELKK